METAEKYLYEKRGKRKTKSVPIPDEVIKVVARAFVVTMRGEQINLSETFRHLQTYRGITHEVCMNQLRMLRDWHKKNGGGSH